MITLCSHQGVLKVCVRSIPLRGQVRGPCRANECIQVQVTVSLAAHVTNDKEELLTPCVCG